jgi:hypothetical protein
MNRTFLACARPTTKYFMVRKPGKSPVKVAGYDGCAVVANNTDANALTHEVGHWLGLLHPWHYGCAPGDFVEDTTPQETIIYKIPWSQVKLDNDTLQVHQCGAWHKANHENFMEYT